ncbi:hypothetical protein EDD22DRAFT_853324 [Suillus occidentalis]|nr:hypothetical protein EDD22DRAFT_853324 [Suillus occidentalis]
MHLSFRVVLAAIAALTVSMAVSANTECYPSGHLCNSKAECCSGYNCVPVLDPQVDEHYSLTTKIDVRHNEPRRLLVDGNFTQVNTYKSLACSDMMSYTVGLNTSAAEFTAASQVPRVEPN